VKGQQPGETQLGFVVSFPSWVSKRSEILLSYARKVRTALLFVKFFPGIGYSPGSRGCENKDVL
jgi:hypothetical protein